MEKSFYKGRLAEKHGLDVIIPGQSDRVFINKVIYDELCLGIINDSSREIFKEIISKMVTEGAEGIILGCTEIPLLINQKDINVPIFDTTKIHAEKAVEMALY